MIPVGTAAAALLSFVQPATTPAAVRETRCQWMVQEPGQPIRQVAATGVNVLVQTAQPGPFAPPLPAHAVALQCGRTSIVPAAHDEEVLDLRLPFYIVELTNTNTGRAGVLEVSDGQYRYRLLEGRLTEEEAVGVQAVLNTIQTRSQKGD